MERYIKPECEVIRMETTNGFLAGSDPENFSNGKGSGVWHAPQRRNSYGDFDDEEDFE